MATLFLDIEQHTIQDNGAGYARRLSAVLGNGAEWEYRGECMELQHATGKCACGHCGLKYLFTIRHPDGRACEVGSSCIVSYPGVSPALADRLEADIARLEAERRERERKAREAAKREDVQRLLREWSEAEYAIDQAVADWHDRNGWRSWLPRPIYNRPFARQRLEDRDAGKVHCYCVLPALKTANGQAKRLQGRLAECARKLAEVKSV